MQPVYIVSAVRTPIGKFGGSLAELAAADLGAIAAKAALERGAQHGLATLCVSGSLGMALALETASG